MDTEKKSLSEIHGAVLLFGLSGLFGKMLTLSPMVIVLGRVVFSGIFLAAVLFFSRRNFRLKKKQDYLYLILTGIILAVHWTTFFMSIQISTVAVGLLTFSTFPVFVTFLEPVFFREKIRKSDILAALATFGGVVLVMPAFELGNNLAMGALWGLISGLTYAVLSLMNRKYAALYDASVIAFYEQVSATVVLLPALFILKPVFRPLDIALLALLGIVFTGISHTMFISGLRHVKTRTAGIVSCLEPVYGILFAVVLLGEIPAVREIIGGLVILGAVFYSTLRSEKILEKEKQ